MKVSASCCCLAVTFEEDAGPSSLCQSSLAFARDVSSIEAMRSRCDGNAERSKARASVHVVCWLAPRA